MGDDARTISANVSADDAAVRFSNDAATNFEYDQFSGDAVAWKPPKHRETLKFADSLRCEMHRNISGMTHAWFIRNVRVPKSKACSTDVFSSPLYRQEQDWVCQE